VFIFAHVDINKVIPYFTCAVQACHMHAGYVLDQEGDSWAVAFHDADDAVAFSLQVSCGCSSDCYSVCRPYDGQDVFTPFLS
jgi:hypothetical protein